MKKIAVFLENYRAGGLDRVVIDTLLYWPEKDDKFIFYCNHEHAGLDNIQSELDGRIERVVLYPSPGYMRRLCHGALPNFIIALDRAFYVVIGCYLKMPFEIFHFFRLFRSQKFDALIVHNGGWPAARGTRSATVAGKLAGIKKNIYVIHSLAVYPRALIFLQERLVSLIINATSIIITVSSGCAQTLKKYAKLDGVSVIYNGIRDIEFLSKNSLYTRKQLGFNEDHYLIITIGTLDARRGHQILLRAFSKLLVRVPNAKLLVAGTGTNAEIRVIEESINKLSLIESVTMLGFRSDVSDLISACDVVVNAVQEYESFGLVAVEAMAMEKPAITSNSCGCANDLVLNDKNGYIFRKGNSKELSKLIIKILQNKKIESRLKKEVKKKLKFYTIDKNVKDILNIT